MSKHVDRFTGRVEDYERYRTRYPRQVIEVLRERCGLGEIDLVVDVGAGTGMVAELFLENGNPVIAIEPNAEMRNACARNLSRFDRVRVEDATAETTGLGDASVDLVAAGRAFHWFDRERALPEFKRILKPGGWVVLLANRRARDGSEMAREYEAILLQHGRDYEQVRGGYRSFEGLRPYGDAETFEVKMPGEQRLTLEEFLGQTQSLSVTPMPGDAKYAGMQAALKEFFLKWSVGGVMRMETACQVTGWRT
jgi:SAM-dependent methyltransferase